MPPQSQYGWRAVLVLATLSFLVHGVVAGQPDDASSVQPPMYNRAATLPETPPAISALAEADRSTVEGKEPAPDSTLPTTGTATAFLSDVYRGLDGVKPGAVKYLRVMEQVPKPQAAEVDSRRCEDRGADGSGGHLVVSHNTHIGVAVLWGIVPVKEDGSACFKAPAGRNLFFQVLDDQFMEVQRMRTFVSFEPDEIRSCVGCHEHRTQAPQARAATALGRTPVPLAAQPGEVAPRPVDYVSDVQPIFDRHCIQCHDGGNPQVDLDLRNDLTTLFNVSYESIFKAKLVPALRERGGASCSMENAEPVAPYSLGSHRSHLIRVLKVGHNDVELSPEEWIRLVTWIDCGAPYYGSYFGRRHLKYQGQDDFRPVPTVESALGIPPTFPALKAARE